MSQKDQFQMVFYPEGGFDPLNISLVNQHELFEVEFLDDARTPSLVCGDTSFSRKKSSYLTLAHQHDYDILFNFLEIVHILHYSRSNSDPFINQSC